jgi:hypothetical protein
MASKMATVFTSGPMATAMKASGKTAWRMAKVLKSGPMAADMLAIGRMAC